MRDEEESDSLAFLPFPSLTHASACTHTGSESHELTYIHTHTLVTVQREREREIHIPSLNVCLNIDIYFAKSLWMRRLQGARKEEREREKTERDDGTESGNRRHRRREREAGGRPGCFLQEISLSFPENRALLLHPALTCPVVHVPVCVCERKADSQRFSLS